MTDLEELMHREKMLNFLHLKQAQLLYLSDLLDRLDRHIVTMTKRQEESAGGKLLIEATEAIETLVIEEGGEENATDSERKESAS